MLMNNHFITHWIPYKMDLFIELFLSILCQYHYLITNTFIYILILWKVFIISSGFCNVFPHTGWLLNRNLFSQFWEAEVQNQGVDRITTAVALWGFFVPNASASLHPISIFPLPFPLYLWNSPFTFIWHLSLDLGSS